MKKPDAILCSDFHLREDTPVCRTDNFWETQWQKVDFVSDLQKQYDCPVLHAGDLFNHWKPSPYVLSSTMKHLPDKFYTIYGQHDLPQHNLELKHKSGVYVLQMANKINQYQDGKFWLGLFPFNLVFSNWGIIPNGRDATGIINVLIWHNFTYVGKEPFPGATGKAHALLEKYKQFDLIVTGDNHQSFTLRGISNNLLVNPGSLTRQDADQIDFQPKVYLWYAEDNSVEAVNIPIEKDAVSREHIEVKQEHYRKMEAYISKMDDSWELTVDFDENLDRFFNTNRVRKQVKEIVYKAKEEVK